MFNCVRCGKNFKRKDSLLRHIKTIHATSNTRGTLLNGDVNMNNQFENTANHLPNNDTYIKNTENTQDFLEQKESLKSNNGDSDGENDYSFERNNMEEEENKSKRSLDPFDKSMIETAAEAIKTKFDSLRKSHNILQFGDEKDNQSNENEHNLSTFSHNYNEANSSPKLAGLLQTALDILMIKELKNVSVKNDEEEEQERKNFIMQTERKRPLTPDSMNEDVEAKRFNTIENGNGEHLKYVERKYWHNPNTLIEELRNLMTTTCIGEEMFEIVQKLMNESFTNSTNFGYYVKNGKQRNELIQNLNKLKETNIGQQILSIIRELEKAEIIEPMLSDILNDYDSSDNQNNTANESAAENDIIGEGLYLKPYRRY